MARAPSALRRILVGAAVPAIGVQAAARQDAGGIAGPDAARLLTPGPFAAEGPLPPLSLAEDGGGLAPLRAEERDQLRVSGQIQFRYVANFRDDAEEEEDFASGFETRRIKIRFDGHLLSPRLFYAVQGQFDRNGGTFRLDEDAHVGFHINEKWSVRGGLFKLPFLRERLMSSKRQLAVDRTITDQVFSQGDQSEGVELSRRGDRWRLFLAVSDGLGSGPTPFTSNIVLPSPASRISGEARYAITARVEHRVAGDWSRFRDFTSPRGAAPLAVMLGGALHWQDGADTPASSDVELLSWTADASVEGDGWNVFAAYVGRTLDVDNPAAIAAGGDFDSTDHGLIVQGGVRITDRLEPFARYDAIFPGGGNGGPSAFSTVTAGLNYYLLGHAAKFTLDAQWFLDAADRTSLIDGNITGIGFLDNGGQDNEFVVRAQFQLLF